jgi:hypothetical protein
MLDCGDNMMLDHCLLMGIDAINRTENPSVPLDYETEKGRLVSFTIQAALAVITAIASRKIAARPLISTERRLFLTFLSTTAVLYTLFASYVLSKEGDFIWKGILNGCLKDPEISLQ